jgi:hypothetical protein
MNRLRFESAIDRAMIAVMGCTMITLIIVMVAQAIYLGLIA